MNVNLNFNEITDSSNGANSVAYDGTSGSTGRGNNEIKMQKNGAAKNGSANSTNGHQGGTKNYYFIL